MMKFTPDGHQHNNLIYADISLGGETLTFSTKPFTRMSFTDSRIFFDNVNAYLEDVTPEKQLELFLLYKEAKEIINEIKDINRIRSELMEVVRKITDIVDYDDVHSWASIYGKYTVPPDLKQEVPEPSNELNRRLTYIYSDYLHLVSLVINLKFLTPIFGDYLELVNKEIDTKFKDQSAFTLLAKSELLTSTPMERLKVYVDAYILKEHSKSQPKISMTSAIFGGLGVDELPDWLLARAVVRKLGLYEERFEKNNAVAAICTHFDQIIGRMDREFGGPIVNKERTISSSSFEDKASFAENYKIKQTISDGDLAVLSIYTDDVETLVRTVDPTVDLSLLKLCSENIENKTSMNISEHQIRLTQWVLSPAISPRGIPILNKPSLLKAIVATQTILWHWGFHELAALMTSIPYLEEGFSSPSFPRIDNPTIKRLDALYPHRQIKSQTSTVRNSNPAMLAINKMVAMISKCDWECLSPTDLDGHLGLDPKVRIIYVNSDLPQTLASLIEKMNEMGQSSAY